MANENSLPLPLYEKHWYKNKFRRVMDTLILILLLLLVSYRAIKLVNNYTFHWFIAFMCESWFTLAWIFTFSTQWSPALIKTHPHRLLQRVEELPAVDLFVTTADPVLEPPIITVNTVLSLLALDYPSHKLACYVSDDGCSPLTFYALQEAANFAKFWVPFCKKYNVQVRAPFRYFCDGEANEEVDSTTPEFKHERLWMKDKYDEVCRRIEDAARTSNIPCLLVDGQFQLFSNTQRNHHPPIIKVIWENKERVLEGLPHLIYISREKRPKHPHHFKAGAMNVLTRVSGLMTNAPFILNVDCDMFVNNPKIIQHAMCVLLDPKGQKEVAFAQFPQKFYAGLKDDPLGNQMVVLFKYLAGGLAGLQGPFYGGTNCFHRRKVIYGLSPDNLQNGKNMLEEKELRQKFGASKELVKAASHALEGRIIITYSPNNNNDINVNVEAAHQVAACGYEYGTAWGDQVGWIYGSMTEDVLTGLTIHRKGWRSEMCFPDPTAFTGCAPVGLPSSLTQQKRWATGMLEIFFSKHCPFLATVFGNLGFRQFLAYMWIMNWGFQPLAEVSYASVLAYCIITNSNFLPQGQALGVLITLVVVHMVYNLSDYLETGLSIRAWWNNHRMSRIYVMNARFSGFCSIILKFLRISNTVFDITRKDQNNSSNDDGDAARFTFNESSIFVPGTTILMMQLAAMVIKLLGLLQPQLAPILGNGCGLGELLCSAYLVICYWPFLRGLFGRGKYGIPLSTICKSASLAFLFVKLCTRAIAG